MTYSGNVKLLLESTLASDANAIKKAISKLGASGSTAGGEALKMAYEEALANFSFYFLSLHSSGLPSSLKRSAYSAFAVSEGSHVNDLIS